MSDEKPAESDRKPLSEEKARREFLRKLAEIYRKLRGRRRRR